MIFNYLLLAWRNLTADKTVSFINIFGLSIAVACCVTVFLFLKNYWSLDNFHAHGDRIFIVEYQTEADGQTQTWGDAPAPMAQALVADFPQVERTVRVRREGIVVSSGEHTFEEMLTYADTGYFSMFTFPLALGSRTGDLSLHISIPKFGTVTAFIAKQRVISVLCDDDLRLSPTRI